MKLNTMNTLHQDRIRNSFYKITPKHEKFARYFYDFIREHSPEFEPLYKGNYDEQGKRIVRLLQLAIVSLDKLPSMLPIIASLAKKDMQHQIKREEYPMMCEALTYAFEKVLGADFDETTGLAWKELINIAKESFPDQETTSMMKYAHL